MDFSITDTTQALIEQVDDFVRSEVVPLEKGLLDRGFNALEPALRLLRAKVKQRGLWAPQASRDVGGMGLPLMEFAHISEVLGRSPLGHFVFGCQAPDAGNIEILERYGTPEQRARFLLPLARGEIRSCFSMTEPDRPGSDPAQLGCEAVVDGNHYIINGKKWFTSAADGAAFAIVMVVTNPSQPPHLRASQIIVPTDTPGFERVRNIGVMGHRGEGYASHAEIHYHSCRVPKSHLLGQEGGGFLIAQERLGPGRIHHCMRWIGICERAFDLLCSRAASRSMGDHVLSSKQIVQAWIADSRAQINAARLLVLDAAWKIDRRGFHAAQVEIALIKFYVAEVMGSVIDRAIQVHGALGISDDTILSYFYTQERGARIYDGPDEVHRVSAAKRILRRYEPTMR